MASDIFSIASSNLRCPTSDSPSAASATSFVGFASRAVRAGASASAYFFCLARLAARYALASGPAASRSVASAFAYSPRWKRAIPVCKRSAGAGAGSAPPVRQTATAAAGAASAPTSTESIRALVFMSGPLLHEKNVLDVDPGHKDLAHDGLHVAALGHRSLHLEDEAHGVGMEHRAVLVRDVPGVDLLELDPDRQRRCFHSPLSRNTPAPNA